MEQSYLILEQESSHVFLLRAGEGRLESHKSDVHRQNHGCGPALHQGVGAGDRSGAESISTMPDTSPAWWQPQTCSVGQCGPKTARTESKGVNFALVYPWLPVHTSISEQWLCTWIQISVGAPAVDTNPCSCLQCGHCRGPSLHIPMEGSQLNSHTARCLPWPVTNHWLILLIQVPEPSYHSTSSPWWLTSQPADHSSPWGSRVPFASCIQSCTYSSSPFPLPKYFEIVPHADQGWMLKNFSLVGSSSGSFLPRSPSDFSVWFLSRGGYPIPWICSG